MRCDERLSPSVCISHFEHEILSSLAWLLCRHTPFFLLVLALVSIVSPSIHFINRLSCSACVSQHALYKRQATPVDRSQSITGLKHTCVHNKHFHTYRQIRAASSPCTPRKHMQTVGEHQTPHRERSVVPACA